jgi:hypothetical protein
MKWEKKPKIVAFISCSAGRMLFARTDALIVLFSVRFQFCWNDEFCSEMKTELVKLSLDSSSLFNKVEFE